MLFALTPSAFGFVSIVSILVVYINLNAFFFLLVSFSFVAVTR